VLLISLYDFFPLTRHSITDLVFKNAYKLGKFIIEKIINRKFRVPRKQGAHFLGARAQIQDFWVFHLQYEIYVRQSTIMLYVRNFGLLPDAG
jgi:hypothetical protein